MSTVKVYVHDVIAPDVYPDATANHATGRLIVTKGDGGRAVYPQGEWHHYTEDVDAPATPPEPNAAVAFNATDVATADTPAKAPTDERGMPRLAGQGKHHYLATDQPGVVYVRMGLEQLNRLRAVLSHSNRDRLTPWEVVEIAADEFGLAVETGRAAGIEYARTRGAFSMGHNLIASNCTQAADTATTAAETCKVCLDAAFVRRLLHEAAEALENIARLPRISGMEETRQALHIASMIRERLAP